MSRHRDVRNMDYTDDYAGYEDDIYGHSVEDDFYGSPSHNQFMYNRDNSTGQPTIVEYLSQDSCDEEASQRSAADSAKLEKCIQQIEATSTTIDLPRSKLIDIITQCNYDANLAIDSILNEKSKETQEKVFDDSNSSYAKLTTTAGGKTSGVARSFDLNLREASSPRSISPASGRNTPSSRRTGTAEVGRKQDLSQKETISKPEISPRSESPNDEVEANSNKSSKGDDVLVQYQKERADSKQHLYMVVIGHVDAGKSTLMGHLLCALGQVSQKTMHKFEQDSKKIGKQSFMYAWVLDETGEERNRGITMDVGRFRFETQTKMVTLLDAPGHRDFIPNMISGASQADVALLVVDATRGEFETGFDYGGQTREHALLVRSLGVTQLAVIVNKLDTVSWSKDRFDEISNKLKVFLRQAGFREADVTFVPCSGLTGQNLIHKPTENELLAWYQGPCLLDVIDNFRTPQRPITKPFRMSIDDIIKNAGSGCCVSGRVETGAMSVRDRVMICPNKDLCTVKSLSIEEISKNVVFAGDQVFVTLTGIDMQNVSVGNILCDPQNPVQVTTKFEARIVVFGVAVPITKGFPVVLHHQALVEPATISKLVSNLDKSSGQVIKKRPRFLTKNSSAIVEIQVSRPISVELFSDCKELGRFMLRVGGVTIAAGLITKVF